MMNVIPAPFQFVPGVGAFKFRRGTRVECFDTSNSPVIERFCQDVLRRTGIRLAPVYDRSGAAPPDIPSVRVAIGRGIERDLEALPRPSGVSPGGDYVPDERYSLAIEAERIVLRAFEAAGATHGLTTLLQLLATTVAAPDGTIALPAQRILDTPRFAWRGLTLDVARLFLPMNELRRIVDLLALYKFNVLHLHFTDDQAWRIAAGRAANHTASESSTYTNAELRDLVVYAADRFVTIVPEADTPGHATSLMRMHPELNTGRNSGAWLDPDVPATFELVESIWGILAGVFPGTFVHLGGSEPFGMPDEAYKRYMKHLYAHVRSLGKRTVAFQESVRAITDSDHVIQSWTSPTNSRIGSDELRFRDDIVQALKLEVPVIVSPVSHTYFDVPYTEPSIDPVQETMRSHVGLHRLKARTVAETFDWEPVHALSPDARFHNIAGIGAVVWTETAKSPAELSFLMLPRLPGTAQRAWSKPAGTSWGDHSRALAAHRRLWAQDDRTYFKSSEIDWMLERTDRAA